MREIIRLTSMQNPLVKNWRALREHKGREEQHLFIAEGDHLTGEALNAHAAQALLAADDALEKFPRHIAAAQEQGIGVYALPAHVFAALCDTKTPQGVCAVCRLPMVSSVRSTMDWGLIDILVMPSSLSIRSLSSVMLSGLPASTVNSLTPLMSKLSLTQRISSRSCPAETDVGVPPPK